MPKSDMPDEYQMQLFEAQAEKQLPEAITLMRKLYGKHDQKDCGSCIHFIRHRSPRYTQCTQFIALGGAENKWLVSWPACGRFSDARE